MCYRNIVTGGITRPEESQSFSQPQDSSVAEEDLTLPSLLNSQPEAGSPLCTPGKTTHKDGESSDPVKATLGSELFVRYLCQLVSE